MTKLMLTKYKKMEVKLIKSKKDYDRALERLEVIFNAKKGTKEGDELELLSIIIDDYESRVFPIANPDPIEAIEFRMEQMGYEQNDLAKIIGLKSRASEILNRKRKLTLEMIRKISSVMKIPTEILIQNY
jgi:HTH-type transcriptional regulator / antitoxin HigA